MANARRANIPLYRQTDPKYFPDYEYREYPKEMKDENGKSIITNPIYLMTTPRDPEAAPKQVLRNGEPIVIGGEPTIVHNKDEEDEFLKLHPECAKIVQIPINDTERLAADNERMRQLLAENERLKALLEQPVQDAEAPARKKPGRPPKLRAVPASTDLPPDLK